MKLFSTTTTLLAAAIALAAGLSAPAFAQGKDKSKLKSKHGPWEVHCIEKTCWMSQVATKNGVTVMTLTVKKLLKPKKIEKDEVVGRMRVLTPLLTSLPTGIRIHVDENKAPAVPFLFCSPLGCEAQPLFTKKDLASFSKGKKLQMVYKSVAKKENITVPFSLEKFAKAYGDL